MGLWPCVIIDDDVMVVK